LHEPSTAQFADTDVIRGSDAIDMNAMLAVRDDVRALRDDVRARGK